MLKLSENKSALVNLGETISAIETLDYLINFYQEPKIGTAYCTFEGVALGNSKVQIDRKIMVKALESQRERLVEYLYSLGIDAN